MAKLAAKEQSIDFDVSTTQFSLPFAPGITLVQFAMKGEATRQGMKIAQWDGLLFSGHVTGTANVRWGNTWSVDGVMTARGVNAAVFAPALVSERPRRGHRALHHERRRAGQARPAGPAGGQLHRVEGRARQLRPVARAADRRPPGDRPDAVRRDERAGRLRPRRGQPAQHQPRRGRAQRRRERRHQRERARSPGASSPTSRPRRRTCARR